MVLRNPLAISVQITKSVLSLCVTLFRSRAIALRDVRIDFQDRAIGIQYQSDVTSYTEPQLLSLSGKAGLLPV